MTRAKPSKSERKRAHRTLQELGANLIGLTRSELEALPLDEAVRQAILDAANMTSRNALQRHRRRIGRLMGNMDPQPLIDALEIRNAGVIRDKQVFAEAECWRNRIVAEGIDAVQAFEAATGQSGDELRLLAAELAAARDDRNETTLRRKIFRRLHTILGRIPR